jgi:hypothetical protein
MKKLFTLLSLVFIFTFANAQRHSDLLVTAVTPTGTVASKAPFNLACTVQNLGPSAVTAADTLTIFLVINGSLVNDGTGHFYGKAFYNTPIAVNASVSLTVLTGFSVNVNPQGILPICDFAYLQNRNPLDSNSDQVQGNNLGCNNVFFTYATGFSNLAAVDVIINAISVYPNPVVNETKINYSVSQQSDIKISIKDLQGREVMQVLNENQATGLYEKSLNLSSLSTGVYFVEYTVGDKVYTSKLIKN